MSAHFTPRVAVAADVPALRALIEESARGLSVGFYTHEQIDSAVKYVFGVDTQLVADGSYYLVSHEGHPVAAGGWSKRRTLYGGDQMKELEDPLLDPSHEAARIRAFFVHPSMARRGLGRLLYITCATAAWNAGFRRLELMATMPGVPLYEALGFVEVERVITTLPDGVDVPFVRMSRPIDPPGSPG